MATTFFDQLRFITSSFARLLGRFCCRRRPRSRRHEKKDDSSTSEASGKKKLEPWSDEDIATVYSLFCNITAADEGVFDQKKQKYVKSSIALRKFIEEIMKKKVFTLDDMKALTKLRIKELELMTAGKNSGLKIAAEHGLRGLRNLNKKLSDKSLDSKKPRITPILDDKGANPHVAIETYRLQLEDIGLPNFSLAKGTFEIPTTVTKNGKIVLGPNLHKMH